MGYPRPSRGRRHGASGRCELAGDICWSWCGVGSLGGEEANTVAVEQTCDNSAGAWGPLPVACWTEAL
eukprot:3022985-Pyramimonas_sp.AAC.1